MDINESKHIEINGSEFNVYPFSAFKAANMSGDILGILTPIITAYYSIRTDEDTDILPALAAVIKLLDGDTIERLLRKLLIENKNIEATYNGDTELLTEEMCDKIFAGNLMSMVMLAYEVIKVNYGDFFDNLGSLFGNAEDSVQ